MPEDYSFSSRKQESYSENHLLTVSLAVYAMSSVKMRQFAEKPTY